MENGLLDLRQGDMVAWDNGDSVGYGQVCGMATIPITMLGRSVILRIMKSNVNTVVYPYSHCVMPEIFLTVAKPQD